MNGMPFGRFLGLLFFLSGAFLLSMQAYFLFTSDIYHPKVVSLGFELFLLGLIVFIVPGVPDLRYDSSDGREMWTEKGDIWMVAIQKSPWLLVLYGTVLSVGIVILIYAGAYMQKEPLTDQSLVFKSVLGIGVMVLVSWFYLRVKRKNRQEQP